MTPANRLHLRTLDRALLSLADERARLLSTEPGRAAVDDLLRRHEGPLSAENVRALFDVLDRACATEELP